MRGGLLLFALASASVIACTFIVDGEFKDFGSTCQISGLNDNVCGQCMAKSCQAKIDALCTNASTVSNIQSCAQNPNPGNEWNCSNLIGDAALSSSGVSAQQNDLNHCISDNCTDACTTCTSVDYGTGACGSCIKASCGARLNGNDGCCENTGVTGGIAKAVAAVNPGCGDFMDIVGPVWAEQDASADSGQHDAGFETCKQSSAQDFANCVVTSCAAQCKCQ
jgi:hypothetical protein